MLLCTFHWEGDQALAHVAQRDCEATSQEILKSHLDTDTILGNWLTTDSAPHV